MVVVDWSRFGVVLDRGTGAFLLGNLYMLLLYYLYIVISLILTAVSPPYRLVT